MEVINVRVRLILICAIFFSIEVQAQIFEGKIIYENSYKSKMLNISDKQLSDFMGTRQEYIIKGNKYKSIFNGSFLKVQIYNGDDNKIYNLTSKSDTFYWEDYSKKTDTILKYEVSKNRDTVLNIPCNVLSIYTNQNKLEYYYNSVYSVDPTLFSKHNYANWDDIVLETRALPLKTVLETKQFILTSTAVDISNIIIDKNIFEISDMSKIVPAKW